MTADLENSKQETQHVARWHGQSQRIQSRRTRHLAIASCLFATLIGTLLAVASLPSSRNEIVLVSLYLSPLPDLADGVDAPHPPEADRLFGLTAINSRMPASQKQGSTAAATEKLISNNSPIASLPKNAASESLKSGTTDEQVAVKKDNDQPLSTTDHPDNSKPVGELSALSTAANEDFNWRQSLQGIPGGKQAVLHVSAIANFEHGQVFFVGRDQSSREQHISLSDVLSALRDCPAKSKLLVLEIHWPTLADSKSNEDRTAIVNAAVQSKVANMDLDGVHVLLSASGDGVSRGLTDRPRSLLSHFLSRSLTEPAADVDHDGRLTLEEAIHWAGPRIAFASSKRGPPQQIRWLPSNTAFTFDSPSSVTSDQIKKAVRQRVYPESLAAAWEGLEIYIANTTQPWLPDLSRQRAFELSALESRWRCGEPLASLEHDLSVANAQWMDAVRAGRSLRSAMRADSIHLAADPFVDASQAKQHAQSASELLQEHSELVRSVPAETRDAFLEKAAKRYITNFDQDGSPTAVLVLLRAIERSSHLNGDLLRLIQRVVSLSGLSRTYPITEAIDLLVAENVNNPNRIGLILKLHQIQDRLGSCPSATALLLPLSQRASRNLVDAQRLVWNQGMVSQEEIDRRLEIAISSASSAWMAEETIAKTLRRLQVIGNTIAIDGRLRVQWDHDRDYMQLQEKAILAVTAIENLAKEVEETNRIRPSQLAMIRQASETMQSHWQRMVSMRVNRLNTPGKQPPATLSSSLSSRHRSVLLSRKLPVDEFDNLLSVNSVFAANQPGDTGSSSGSSIMCLTTLDERLNQITKNTGQRYRQWLNAYFGRARSITAIQSYGRIAEHNSIGSDFSVPVAIRGDLNQFNWDRPSATIEIQYTIDLQEADDVAFRFLPPAASNLTVSPAQGTLRAGQTNEVRLALSSESADEIKSVLRGVWLELLCGNDGQLVPLAMPALSNQPAVEVFFDSSATVDGRHVTLQRWPDRQPQPLLWNVISHDPDIKSVVAIIEAANGRQLTSPPIPVKNTSPAPLRFLPAPEKNGSISDLTGDLSLTITDSAKKTILGHWRIETKILDPRVSIAKGIANFEAQSSGRNQLRVELHRSPESDPKNFSRLRLDLDASTNDSLIDFGTSRLQAELGPTDQPTVLFANDLRFQENFAPEFRVPVSINGDDGRCEFDCRFPRLPGSVEMSLANSPRLEIVAPNAAYPGDEMIATIRARHFEETESLVLTITDDNGAMKHALWRKTLPAPRRGESRFFSGANDATLQVVASEYDWEVSVPTEFGTGVHWLHVQSTNLIGTTRVRAKHRFVLDKEVPSEVRARAEVAERKTEIRITMQPSLSGVRSVVAEPITHSKESKVKPMTAARIADDGSQWGLAWPKGLALSEQIRLTITTGAGKTFETTSELPTQEILSMGIVSGRVLEGSIPQPRTKIVVINEMGVAVRNDRTGDQGRFQLRLPAGKYWLKTEKKSTNRHAEVPITVEDSRTRSVDLQLLRSA